MVKEGNMREKKICTIDSEAVSERKTLKKRGRATSSSFSAMEDVGRERLLKMGIIFPERYERL